MGRLARSVVRRFRQIHGQGEPTPTAPQEPEEEGYSPSIAPSQAEESIPPEDNEPYERYAGFMIYVDEETNRGRLPHGMAVMIGELVRRFERYQKAAEDPNQQGARDQELEELQRRCEALSEALNQGEVNWEDVRRKYHNINQTNQNIIHNTLRDALRGAGEEEGSEPPASAEAEGADEDYKKRAKRSLRSLQVRRGDEPASAEAEGAGGPPPDR